MQASQSQMVAALLGRAGSAHGVYEERELGGVYDEQWPQWYATYLVEHDLGSLVGVSLTVERVTDWLSGCDAAYRAERPSVGWAEYYAERAALLRTGV